jgi:hypothetical protein
MKKTVITFVIAGLVLITFILWGLTTRFTWDPANILMVAGGVIVVGFAFGLGINRLRSLKRKEPVEDELSKKTMIKASSLSFYISIYFWLGVMYVSDRIDLESHSLIGAGILGMSIIFFLSWGGIKLFGTGHD